MVAHTPTALPTLSPEDQSLLLRYFAASEDPSCLPLPEGGGRGVGSSSPAPHPSPTPSPLGTRDSALSTSLLSLYSFLSRPDIAAWVAFHREHQAHLQKQLALNQLAAVCKSSPNPVEQRRAATTLLRGLTTPSVPKSKRLPGPEPAPRPPNHSSPDTPGTQDSCHATSPLRQQTHQTLNTTDPPIQIQQSPNSTAVPGRLDSLIALPTLSAIPTTPITQLLSLQGSTIPRVHSAHNRTKPTAPADSS